MAGDIRKNQEGMSREINQSKRFTVSGNPLLRRPTSPARAAGSWSPRSHAQRYTPRVRYHHRARRQHPRLPVHLRRDAELVRNSTLVPAPVAGVRNPLAATRSETPRVPTTSSIPSPTHGGANASSGAP